MNTRRHFLSASSAALGGLALGGLLPRCADAAASPRIALILTGSITDGGWNQLAYEGLARLEVAGSETAYFERASQSRIPQIAQGYVDDGFDLIIGHGFEFQSAFSELAPEYPGQNFFVTTNAPGASFSDNLMFVDLAFVGSSYGAGHLCGLISERGKAVGFVGGGDNPIQQAVMRAFIAGAEAARPGLKGLGIITGDYDNASRGKEAAETMIANGADVIWHAAGVTGLGAIQGAVANGVKSVGSYGDQLDVGPGSVATSMLLRIDEMIETLAGFQSSGSFMGGTQWAPPVTELWGFAAGDHGDFDPALISADQWRTFQETWNALGANLIDLTAI